MFLLLAPFSVIFAIFLLFPLVYGVVLSLSDQASRFSVLNYLNVLHDEIFGKALLNTLFYITGNIFLAILSLLIAILIKELNSEKLAKKYETLMIFPYVIPMVVTGIVFKYIFQPQIGLFSGLLRLLGLAQFSNVALLSDPFYAKVVITLVWIFVYTGYMVNIYYSSLREIPASYYEAASIDGSNWFQRMFQITIPLLSNIFVYTIVSGIILSFQIFPLIWILTGSGFGLGAGGPDNSTMSLDLYIYQTAFRDHNLYSASAMGVIMLAVTYLISLIPMKLVKEVNYV